MTLIKLASIYMYIDFNIIYFKLKCFYHVKFNMNFVIIKTKIGVIGVYNLIINKKSIIGLYNYGLMVII